MPLATSQAWRTTMFVAFVLLAGAAPLASADRALIAPPSDASPDGETWSVLPDEAAWADLTAGRLQRFDIPLPGRTVASVALAFSDRQADGDWTGWGSLENAEMGTFTAVSRGERFLGVIRLPAGPAYELNRTPDGRTTLQRLAPVDVSQPLCPPGPLTPPADASSGPEGIPPCPTLLSPLAGYHADDGSLIDLAVYYTAAARDQAGSDATIQMRIDLAAATTNQVMQSSAIAPRIRVVRKALITYTESGDGVTDLNRLVATSDGFLDSVHPERDTYGADLVELWVANLNAGGVGYSLSQLGPADDGRNTFTVCRQDNWPFETMAHELGHNFGCQHDRVTNPTGGFFNYSYGYREPGSVWKTVMAYPPGMTIYYYSNPAVNYAGPLGNPGPTGVPGDDPNSSCNNALTVANTAWTIANFRPSALPVPPPARLYVRPTAAPGGSGATWNQAMRDVQDAIATAVQSRGVVTEVWVAAGTYKPNRGRTDPLTVRLMSFRPVAGVTVYGGFAGTESLLSQRNVVANETILSGDIGVAGDSSDNSFHVVNAGNLGASAVFDGFTITAGNANDNYPHDSGGGLRVVCGSPTLRNCKLTANHANFSGGGAYFNNATPTLDGCTFSSNTALYSGAIDFSTASGGTLTTCTFSGNQADYGAAVSIFGAAPSLSSCTFTSNTAVHGGGAADIGSGAVASFTLCQFNTNHADFAAGLSIHDGASVQLSQCGLSGNVANLGAAVLVTSASPTITGCTFTLNAAGSGGSGAGGGLLFSAGAAGQVTGCTFTQNSTGCCGGALATWNSSPTVTSCDFVANSGNYGAAVWSEDHSGGTYSACRFYGNTVAFHGGAIHCSNFAAPVFASCVLSGNSANAGVGGAMWNYFSSAPSFVNCTLVGNSAGFGGGGVYSDGVATTFANCILWQNHDGASMLEADQLVGANGGTTPISYSLVQGWTGSLGGTANSGANPQLVDADGPDNLFGTTDDNPRLGSASPAIDSGNNAALPGFATIDAAGNPRRANAPCVADGGAGTAPIVDRGAYEYTPLAQLLGDIDNNGVVNPADVAGFVAVIVGRDSNAYRVAASDMNCDALDNGRDAQLFVARLLGL